MHLDVMDRLHIHLSIKHMALNHIMSFVDCVLLSVRAETYTELKGKGKCIMKISEHKCSGSCLRDLTQFLPHGACFVFEQLLMLSRTLGESG